MDMMSLRRRVLVNQNKLVSATGNPLTFNTPLTKPLKECVVRFTPKQEGSGTPSPDNVMPISGWNGMTVYKAGKNIINIVGFSAQNVTSPTATRNTTNNYGTTLSTTAPASSLVVTQSEAPNEQLHNYHNGYFVIIDDNMVFGQTYRLSFRVTDIISNPLNASLSDWRIISPKGNANNAYVIGDRIYRTIEYAQNTRNPERHGFEIRNCGMSCTISEIMVTPATDEDITYEPPSPVEIPISFPAIGKNLFNWNMPEGTATPTSSSPTPRQFPTNAYIVGFSRNNYYRANYANYVKNVSITDRTISYTSGSASGYGVAFPVQVEAGETYTCSATISAHASIDLSFFDSDGALISYEQVCTNKTPLSVDVPSNTVFTLLVLSNGTANTEHTFSNIQLEKGSTATDYEPFDNTIYGGYVDLVNGEVVAEWATVHAKDLRWSNYSGNVVFYHSNVGRTAESSDISDKLQPYYDYGWAKAPDNSIISGNRTSLFIKHEGVTSAVEFSAWLEEIDPIIAYKLATPNVYPLTPQTIKALKGINNIWSDTNGNITVRYWTR